jgi:hypothetical protein
MGYDTKTEITTHGFRAMARTMLAERLKFPAALFYVSATRYLFSIA